ncbi:hypothetical protein BDK92_4612 [Micromonospora pisi]|uniref:Uncharacterized protein n=1 Tax=Micromonospora pisi TaxID=589240 RepID=A0A495JPD2_9ACTN|nr:hypothetical protein [Micromonospora pisi]RKR90244.1 hypothetical protein BDK92_4612 [Micromonospora pisi]
MNAISERIRSIYTVITRATLAPLLLRCVIFLSGLVAFVLAYPPAILASRAVVLLLIAALLPAIAPGRVWPTLTVLLTVIGWVAQTSYYGEPIELWRLLGLATFLYLTHSLCALAAQLPYDAAVSPDLIARWVVNALAVVLASAVLAVLLIALAERWDEGGFVVAAIAGLAVAALAASLLSWMLRRTGTE